MLSRLDIFSVISRGVVPDSYRSVWCEWKSLPRNADLHIIAIFGINLNSKPTYGERIVKFTRKTGLTSGDLDMDSDFMDKFWLDARMSQLKGRKCEIERRLYAEIEARCTGPTPWYVVFNTLTVNKEAYTKVFTKGSKVWQEYVRKCDKFFGVAANGSYSKALKARAKGDEFHNYFAVVEEGGKTGRLHIHVLHFFKTLPDSFSDPNRS